MKKINIIGAALLVAATLGVAACTDAERAKLGGFGDPARVTCYSGGTVFFDDYSTGKVNNSENSDGYYFMSEASGRLVEISGDCVLDYNAKKPAGFKTIRA